MVAVKVQSKEDIIKAYLKSFGFKNNKLTALTETLTAGLSNINSKNAADIVDFIDNILVQQAKNIFPDNELSDSQLLAQFKLCFLICDGNKYCSENVLKSLKFPAELIKKMQNTYIINAPKCQYTEMKPQHFDD